MYYLHYPKVAIGHWPPGLYGILGIWLLAFGASRGAAMLFMATVAAILATITCLVGAARLGWWAGWFAGVALLALPVAQESTGQVMSEHLASLLMLVSCLQFVRAVRLGASERLESVWRHGSRGPHDERKLSRAGPGTANIHRVDRAFSLCSPPAGCGRPRPPC
jgi:hypothetical protein